MAHRHRVHARARGGKAGTATKGVEVYSGKGSIVEHEAESKKDSFKKGGRHHKKHHLGRMDGGRATPRADRRARGGGVGANKSPFSTAARGEDHKRTTGTVDNAMPRKEGGRLVQFWAGGRTTEHKQKFKHGGRPHPLKHKHSHNYGHHHGAGHEEPLEHHLPVHHKHGGKAHHLAHRKHHHRADGGKVVGSAGDRP